MSRWERIVKIVKKFLDCYFASRPNIRLRAVIITEITKKNYFNCLLQVQDKTQGFLPSLVFRCQDESKESLLLLVLRGKHKRKLFLLPRVLQGQDKKILFLLSLFIWRQNKVCFIDYDSYEENKMFEPPLIIRT